jgi:hypothetical protein
VRIYHRGYVTASEPEVAPDSQSNEYNNKIDQASKILDETENQIYQDI